MVADAFGTAMFAIMLGSVTLMGIMFVLSFVLKIVIGILKVASAGIDKRQAKRQRQNNLYAPPPPPPLPPANP